jgi:hypothetical protein
VPPARGLSHSFDSAEATQRLAALTGAGMLSNAAPSEAEAEPQPQVVLGAVQEPARRGWRRRDWLLLGGAAIAGLIVAGAIVRRER